MENLFRKATVRDIKRIHQILHIYAKRGELLPRALNSLYDHVRDFTVVETVADKRLIGCCALQIWWEDLAEIRSLAVLEEYWNKGTGTRLIELALEEAAGFGIGKVFVLTYRPWVFEKKGFRVVDKGDFPQKIWADCIHCVKFPDCDEIAMIRELGTLS